MKNKKALFITQAAVIAALYVVLVAFSPMLLVELLSGILYLAVSQLLSALYLPTF